MAGLVALLDDIATLAKMAAASTDDVAAATGKASAKAVSVVVDDTAVTPQYLEGITPKRELPIIKRITVGSLRNKIIIILPIALVLSQFAPFLIPPLLLIGGIYLAYEGMEKVWEKVLGTGGDEPQAAQGEDAEDAIVNSAVRTDLILSTEIMIMALNEVKSEGLVARTITLIIVALVITFFVYGIVAIFVKMDDIGAHLAKGDSAGMRALGRGIVRAMPTVLSGVGIIGTFAMIWVGGHLALSSGATLGWEAPEHLVHTLVAPAEHVAGVGGFLGWCVDTACSALVGALVGSLVVGIVAGIRRAIKHDPAPARG
ncbi:MAG: DUF808 domain-containing protein [Actinomycetaceae bacterium]|nr:DUF808 domain-containing protein [Actinomycetaceae bacterium]MDU0971171.1 DUF808 domain-containing protein [Actinomycetaceae bacterium]